MSNPQTTLVPHTETYDSLKQYLGGAIPCYGEPGGCHMDERTDCNDGCILLKVYQAGYEAGNVRI